MSTTITKTARRLTVAFAALGLTAVWAPGEAGAGPPVPVEVSLRFDGSAEGLKKVCTSFAVLVEVQGNTKEITLPTGSKVIVTAPRQTVTVTNLATGTTLDLNIPGSAQIDPDTGAIVFLGANLIIRSQDFGDRVQALLYAKGRFTFVPGQGLTGVGSVTDLCQVLASRSVK